MNHRKHKQLLQHAIEKSKEVVLAAPKPIKVISHPPVQSKALRQVQLSTKTSNVPGRNNNF